MRQPCPVPQLNSWNRTHRGVRAAVSPSSSFLRLRRSLPQRLLFSFLFSLSFSISSLVLAKNCSIVVHLVLVSLSPLEKTEETLGCDLIYSISSLFVFSHYRSNQRVENEEKDASISIFARRRDAQEFHRIRNRRILVPFSRPVNQFSDSVCPVREAEDRHGGGLRS